MVRDIPGFYYDVARGKYFKVQPNHAGPGQQYSTEVVKQKETAAKKRKLYHDYRNREERESVSRSRLLTHPLLGRLSLRNQLGKAARRPLPLNPAEDVAAYYAASLSQRPIYNSFVAIPAFVVDETNGAIILAHAHPGSGNDTLHCLRPLQAGRYGDTPHVFEALPNSIGDMVISPQHKKLLYTCSNERRMLAVLLDVPAEKDDPHHGRIEEVWDFIDETGWQLAVAPDTGACFAIASSGGLRHMRMRPEQTEITSVVGVQGQTRHEYTAAAFGINDRTLMGGKRSGVVTIHDERTHESVRRLSHADGVSVIRMVDEDRVLVRGLTKMCLYDLRYTKAPSAKQAKSKTPTVPYRVFPWENASESFKLGFDYNPELGIIATASRKVATCHYSLSPQREEDIDLFSVRTGKQLDSLFVATTEQWPPLTCITFAHLGNTLAPDLERKFRGGEQLSLLASQGGNITEWSCEGTCPVDEEDGKIDNDSGCVPGDCVVHDFRISSRTRYSTPSSEGSTSASETGRRHRPLFSRPHR